MAILLTIDDGKNTKCYFAHLNSDQNFAKCDKQNISKINTVKKQNNAKELNWDYPQLFFCVNVVFQISLARIPHHVKNIVYGRSSGGVTYS